MQSPDGMPRSLVALCATRLPSESRPDEPLTVRYALSCKTCGSVNFRISGFQKSTRKDWKATISVEQAPIVDHPHMLNCLGCNKDVRLFDAKTDGYDGLLNGGGAYEGSEGIEIFLDQSLEIAVSLTYNVGLEELDELAAEAGVQAADLFDWITINCVPVNGDKPFEFDYECA